MGTTDKHCAREHIPRRSKGTSCHVLPRGDLNGSTTVVICVVFELTIVVVLFLFFLVVVRVIARTGGGKREIGLHS